MIQTFNVVVVAIEKEKRPGCLFFFQIATTTKKQNKEIWYLTFQSLALADTPKETIPTTSHVVLILTIWICLIDALVHIHFDIQILILYFYLVTDDLRHQQLPNVSGYIGQSNKDLWLFQLSPRNFRSKAINTFLSQPCSLLSIVLGYLRSP